MGISQLVSAGVMTTPVGLALKVGKSAATKALDSGLASAKIDTLKGKNQWPTDDSLKGKKTVKQIENTVIPGVNPEYGKLGTVNNCRRATVAYELRRRGINVEARKTMSATGQNDAGMVEALGGGGLLSNTAQSIVGKVTGKTSPLQDYMAKMNKDNKLSETGGWDAIKAAFGSSKAYDKIATEGAEKVFKGLDKQPEGSRGELAVYWLSGGGHSVAYEIIGGKAVIFDTQNGKTYQSPKEMVDAGWATSSSQFTRLDNEKFDKNFVERWVKDA